MVLNLKIFLVGDPPTCRNGAIGTKMTDKDAAEYLKTACLPRRNLICVRCMNYTQRYSHKYQLPYFVCTGKFLYKLEILQICEPLT